MQEVEESAARQGPGGAESGPRTPETARPTRQDKSSPKDQPPRRSCGGPAPLGGSVWVRSEEAP